MDLNRIKLKLQNVKKLSHNKHYKVVFSELIDVLMEVVDLIENRNNHICTSDMKCGNDECDLANLNIEAAEILPPEKENT